MFRYATVVLLALIVALPVLGLGADQPAIAPPPAPAADTSLLPAPPGPVLTPSYRDAVYGDFVVAGNSVLRCPEQGETTGDHSPQDCAAAMAGNGGGGLLDNSSNNNGYFMHQADVDDLTETFDSSTATVTVPKGAVVRHAQLTWGAHTGRFIGFSGVNCVRPLLMQGEAPPSPAAASPADQQVKVSVAGQSRDYAPAGFHTNDGLTEPSQLYTAWADVTDVFAEAPSGKPVPVTVGNVWVPSGPGCAGGWSLTVVFDLKHPTAEYPTPRVVDLYNDDLPQSGLLLPGLIEPLLPGVPPILDGVLPGLASALTGTNVRLPGLTPHRSAADVTIGVTAFDGDYRQGGDTFSVGGEPVVEPCSAEGTADFFRSCATGAPVVNNLSVDAKVVKPALADNDDGTIEVGVDTVEDFVVLGSLAMSEAVDPSITLAMTGPAQVNEGGLATFEVTIGNDGGLPLTGATLRVGAPGEDPRCVPSHQPTLQPGESITVTCVRAMTEPGEIDVPAEVRASYLTGTGGHAGTVTAQASAHVQVVPVELALTRVPDTLVTRAGSTVEFTVRLHNNTDNTLTGIGYSDSVATDCAPPEHTLAAGATMEFTCPVVAGDTAFESNGTAKATTVDNQVLTVTSDTVLVNVIAPALAVSAAVQPDTIYRGGTTELTFTVTNNGTDPDEALTDVHVAVAELCAAKPIPTLAPGETVEATCTAAPTETGDLVATATGTDVTGQPVPATAEPVTVTVLEPTITVTQAVDHPTVRVGDEVVLTFTVTNTGTDEDGPVRDVRITSPTLPGCAPEAIPELAPGQTASATCTAKPDRTFDNQAFAAGVDRFDRVMRVGTTPKRIVVTNPALTISTTADPASAKHDARVDFAVTVRNIGDVPLTVDVTNDNAPDCDVTLDGEGLPAGAANGVRCTVSTPADESATELTDVATYRAQPLPASGDTGPALEGADAATVRLEPGRAQAQPAPGSDPTDPDPAGGGTLEQGGGATAQHQGNAPDNLAWTGANVLGYLGVGVALLALGGIALLGTSRRRDDVNSVVYRWWPGKP